MPQPKFELPPQYDPHHVEAPLYRRWLDRGVFTARADSSREPYVIVMPPPNITAILHTGQGLNNVIQDVLIRFERMRGRGVIHWCPHCLTALSDEEAESVETSGNLYYIRYPLADGTGSVTVATTRPETMLGDTAVAVHPDDPRGRSYVGKKVRLPIVGL